MFGSIRLNVEPLEAREVPAVIGWVKGVPQPEPPTVVGKVTMVKVETTPITLKAGMLLPALSKIDFPSTLPKSGMLLPALNQGVEQSSADTDTILDPVFAGR
ncbi:MAG: hypothetical protein R3B84_01390 [Zavarzinella sp.]